MSSAGGVDAADPRDSVSFTLFASFCLASVQTTVSSMASSHALRFSCAFLSVDCLEHRGWFGAWVKMCERIAFRTQAWYLGIRIRGRYRWFDCSDDMSRRVALLCLVDGAKSTASNLIPTWLSCFVHVFRHKNLLESLALLPIVLEVNLERPQFMLVDFGVKQNCVSTHVVHVQVLRKRRKSPVDITPCEIAILRERAATFEDETPNGATVLAPDCVQPQACPFRTHIHKPDKETIQAVED